MRRAETAYALFCRAYMPIYREDPSKFRQLSAMGNTYLHYMGYLWRKLNNKQRLNWRWRASVQQADVQVDIHQFTAELRHHLLISV